MKKGLFLQRKVVEEEVPLALDEKSTQLVKSLESDPALGMGSFDPSVTLGMLCSASLSLSLFLRPFFSFFSCFGSLPLFVQALEHSGAYFWPATRTR
jgi:hypothetical protein